MNIFKKMWTKLKNLFLKKEEIVMLNEGQDYSEPKRENFKDLLNVKIEKVLENRKKVETHICYGDGLGIKKKLEY